MKSVFLHIRKIVNKMLLGRCAHLPKKWSKVDVLFFTLCKSPFVVCAGQMFLRAFQYNVGVCNTRWYNVVYVGAVWLIELSWIEVCYGGPLTWNVYYLDGWGRCKVDGPVGCRPSYNPRSLLVGSSHYGGLSVVSDECLGFARDSRTAGLACWLGWSGLFQSSQVLFGFRRHTVEKSRMIQSPGLFVSWWKSGIKNKPSLKKQ